MSWVIGAGSGYFFPVCAKEAVETATHKAMQSGFFPFMA
jgi:hypothetical protein